jgi:hypothetical protein
LRKKKGEELTKGGTGPSSSGPLSSTVIRHPLPSDGTETGGGGLRDWDLLFLQWDFFLRRDRDRGPLQDFFLQRDRDRGGGAVVGLHHALPLAGP